MDDFDFDEPKKRPSAPPMAPAITITIGAPQPTPMGELAECEEDGEYTDDLDDYSKPNPMRALKAMMKG